MARCAKSAEARKRATHSANSIHAAANRLRACASWSVKRASFLPLLVLAIAVSLPGQAQSDSCVASLQEDVQACAPPPPNSPLGCVAFINPMSGGVGGQYCSIGAAWITYSGGYAGTLGECNLGCYQKPNTAGGAQSASTPPPSPATSCGSIIHDDNQAAGERVPVVGAPFDLVYFNDRVPGRLQAYTLDLSALEGDSIQVFGQVEAISSPGTFVWNGLDASGKAVQGSILVNVGYYIPILYGTPVDNGGLWILDCEGAGCTSEIKRAPSSAPSLTLAPTEDDQSFFIPYFNLTVGTYRADLLGLGGWSPSILHYYDANAGILYFGDGSNRQVTASKYANGIELIAGNSDGSELYLFNLSGNHLYTLNGKTGSVLYSFAYDSNNHLSSITDAYRNVTKVRRNGEGVLTGIESPYGQITTFTLDANGYLATITNPESETYAMTYYGTGGLLHTFQKPRGQVSTFAYDSSGLLTLESSSAGNSTAFSSTTASPGNVTVQSTTALDLVTSFATISQPGTYSRTTTFPDTTTDTFYSITNTEEQDTSPINSYLAYYQPDARLGSISNFTNYQKVQNWLQTATQSISGWTSGSNPNYFNYTGIDTQSNINGNLWDASFTLKTGNSVVTSPNGRKLTVTTDKFGRPTRLKFAGYTPVTYGYDAHGRLTSVSQGSFRKSSIAYESTGASKGLVSKITDTLNESTEFTYDKAGRILTETLPDSRIIIYTYDSNGNVTSVTPPSSHPHDFTLNRFDLTSEYAPPPVGSTSTNTLYSYDNDERLTQIQRPDGNNVTFTYDTTTGVLTSIALPTGTNTYSISAGLVQSATSVDQVTDAYSYFYNQLTGDAVSVNGSSIGSIDLTENSDFNLTTSVVTPSVGSPSSIDYIYDTDTLLTDAGAETVTETPETGQLEGATLGEIFEAYTYSATFGELSTYLARNSSSSATILQDSYARDDLGRISSKSETEGAKVTDYSYTYDSADRLIGVKKNGSPYSSYKYDKNSNRISGEAGGASFTATHDAQDRLLRYNTKSYTYTPNGDRASVTDSSLPAGSQTTRYTFDELGNLKQVSLPNKLVTYLVDGSSRRVAKEVGSAIQAQYLYRDQYRIEAVLGPTGALVERFVWGTKLNVPDYMIDGGVTYKIISDERGSVRFVVNTATGAIAEQMEYGEFGKVLKDTNPGFQPFGFAGGLYDSDTGLVHFGAREYDASVGRWLSKDPLLFGGGDTNLYGYVLNDPINGLDPSGLDSWWSAIYSWWLSIYQRLPAYYQQFSNFAAALTAKGISWILSIPGLPTSGQAGGFCANPDNALPLAQGAVHLSRPGNALPATGPSSQMCKQTGDPDFCK